MRIVRTIVGTIEVDPEAGVIWVNSFGECVLRFCNLEFVNMLEKFSSIDSNGQKAVMTQSGFEQLQLEKFVFDVAELIYLNGLSEDKEFLYKLFEAVRESIKEKKE